MAFDTNQTVREVAFGHVDQLRKLEEKEVKVLLARYREVRRELQDRLSALAGDTFTAQRLRGVLVQVEAALSEMNDSFIIRLRDVSGRVISQAVDDLVEEIEKFEKEFLGAVTPININAQVVVDDGSSFLFNKYEASVGAYTASTRSAIATGLSQAAIEGAPFGEVTRRIARFFIGEEWKLLRLGRTEIHNMYGFGKQKTLEAAKQGFLPDLQKSLFHPIDGRTGDDSKQLKRIGPVVEIDQPFIFIFKRRRKDGSIDEDRRVFMHPPDRPNDRSILIPFRKEWDTPTS